MIIVYIAGLSEDIMRICRRFEFRVLISAGQTLYSMLTRMNDELPWANSVMWCTRYLAAMTKSMLGR